MSLNAPASAPRRSVSLTVLAVVILVVAGAAVGLTAAVFELRGTASTPSSPGTVRVTDDLGRTENVPTSPARVVVLAPSIMDSMYRLGLRDRVVGVDCAGTSDLASDYDSNQSQQWSLTTSMCVQVLPLAVEALLNLSPTLVLSSTIVSVADVEEVESTYHVSVLILQPPSISGIARDIDLLAQIFPSVQVTATSLEQNLNVELGAVNAFDSNLSYNDAALPTVLLTYYVSTPATGSPGYWTYGPTTFGQSLLELAGAASIAANSSIPYPELSGGQVLVANPSIIIYGTGFTLSEASYAQGPNWDQFSAVSSGHTYGVDSTLITEPGPTMLLTGLPQLIHIMHPTANLG